MPSLALGVLFILGLAPLPAMAQELPAGGNVTSGSAPGVKKTGGRISLTAGDDGAVALANADAGPTHTRSGDWTFNANPRISY